MAVATVISPWCELTATAGRSDSQALISGSREQERKREDTSSTLLDQNPNGS